MTAIIDKESIGNIYNDITAGQRSLDWFLLGYSPNSTNRIILIEKGDGGIFELKKKLRENLIAYGYLKVIDKNAEFPQLNPDYVHLTFIGKNVRPQEKARAVIHRLDIQQEFPRYLIELECNGLEEVTEERMMEELNEMKRSLAD